MPFDLDQDPHVLAQLFESQFHVEYLDHLRFTDEGGELWLQKCLKRFNKNREMQRLNRWTQALFEQPFRKKLSLPLTLKYVNPLVGYGIFAKERIKPLTYISEYTGVVRQRNKKQDPLNDFAFRYIETRFSSPYVIDAQSQGNISRFLNHSDEPNLISRSLILDGQYHVIFFTKRALEKGEQLTYDYGPYYWKKRANPLPL